MENSSDTSLLDLEKKKEAELEVEQQEAVKRKEELMAAKESLVAGEQEAENNGDESTGEGLDKLTQSSTDSRRGEVSAATLGRMMGLVTATDIKLLESKLDLFATRISLLMQKVDKLQVVLQNIPSGNDFERVEAQISSLRTMISSSLEQQGAAEAAAQDEAEDAEKSQKTRENIQTNKRTPGSRYR